MKLTTLFILFVVVISIPDGAYAGEMYDFYTGVRQLGMGGIYTTTVNDETSLLTNPAGLGKIRDLIFTVADPELHGSFNDTQVAKLDNASTVMTIQGLLDALQNAKGVHWHAKAQVFPSLVGPNFGIGLHAKYSYDAELSEDGTIYQLDYTNDFAAVTGFCFRFFGGILKLGFSGRLVDRVEVAKELDGTATNLELANVASEGTGVGVDGGLILSAPVVLFPTVAFVVRDIGNTSYTLNDGMIYTTAERPRDTEQRMDGGISFSPILSNHVRATIGFEYHGINTVADEKDQMRRVHAGTELNVADFFFLRAGLNQRYWTAGLELSSERFQFQVASYGEEIGTVTTSGDTTTINAREDRRWVGKFAFRF